MDDLRRALAKVETLTRPAGRAAFSWGERCFTPAAEALLEDVAAFIPTRARPPSPWAPFNTPEAIRQIFEHTGGAITIISEATRYPLRSVDDWWALVMHSGFRAFVDLVPRQRRHLLRERHLARMRRIWIANGEILLPVHYVLISFDSRRVQSS